MAHDPILRVHWQLSADAAVWQVCSFRCGHAAHCPRADAGQRSDFAGLFARVCIADSADMFPVAASVSPLSWSSDAFRGQHLRYISRSSQAPLRGKTGARRHGTALLRSLRRTPYGSWFLPEQFPPTHITLRGCSALWGKLSWAPSKKARLGTWEPGPSLGSARCALSRSGA